MSQCEWDILFHTCSFLSLRGFVSLENLVKDLETPSEYCPLQGGLELFISGGQSSSILEMMLAGMISSFLGLDLSLSC